MPEEKKVYEDRIKWLKHELYRSELEIARLYKEREISEQEISDLKSQLSVLVKKVSRLEKVAETRLLFIEFREEQVSGELSALQEEISQLKARISELVSKKFSKENTDMASSIHRDIPTILQNMEIGR